MSPLAAFAAACAIGGGTVAAFTATTGVFGNELASGTVRLSDNGNDQALLTLDNVGTGASVADCIRVRSDGTLPSLVRLRAESTGALAPHLRVKVTRGAGAAGFKNCMGFEADPHDYYGLGDGVVYDGRLSDLPAGWNTAVHDPSETLAATSVMPLLAARSGMVGLWELGERTRRADDFSGTAGALVNARPELQGSSWTRQGTSTTNAVLTAAGRLRSEQAGVALYRVGTANLDEVVTADINVQTAAGEAGVMTRVGASTDSGYLVRYSADGTWELARLDDGVATRLDAWSHLIPAGRTGHIVLTHSGSAISARVTAPDGAWHQLAATDDTYAATSRTAVRLVGAGDAADLRGVQLDNFRVYHPGQASGVASVGSAATTLGSVPSTPGLQPSASDVQAAGVFNGSTQALSAPATGVSTSATIAGWFRLAGDASMMMRDSTSGPTAGWSLGFDDGSGTLKFRVSGQVFDTGVPFAPLRNVWRHHALVRNGSSVEYYLDGRRIFQSTVGASTAPASPWLIMRDGSTAAYSAGRADQVAIWNRALGPDELAQIHDAIAAEAEWQEGDVHWYRFQIDVSESPEAAAKTATARFTWEAHSR